MPAPTSSLPQPEPAGTPGQPSGAVHPGTRRIPPLAYLWGTALAVLVADQLTKIWAVQALAGRGRTAVVGDLLGLVLVRNPGAAFSFATGQTWIFTIVAAVVIAVVLRVSRRLASTTWAVALGLVLGGAVGNLVDRLVRAPGVFRGHVVDFIDYGGRFVGNVADIAIVAAAALIIVLSLRGTELDGSRPGAAQPSTPPRRAGLVDRQDDGEATHDGKATDQGGASGQGEAAASGRAEQTTPAQDTGEAEDQGEAAASDQEVRA